VYRKSSSVRLRARFIMVAHSTIILITNRRSWKDNTGPIEGRVARSGFPTGNGTRRTPTKRRAPFSIA